MDAALQEMMPATQKDIDDAFASSNASAALGDFAAPFADCRTTLKFSEGTTQNPNILTPFASPYTSHPEFFVGNLGVESQEPTPMTYTDPLGNVYRIWNTKMPDAQKDFGRQETNCQLLTAQGKKFTGDAPKKEVTDDVNLRDRFNPLKDFLVVTGQQAEQAMRGTYSNKNDAFTGDIDSSRSTKLYDGMNIKKQGRGVAATLRDKIHTERLVATNDATNVAASAPHAKQKSNRVELGPKFQRTQLPAISARAAVYPKVTSTAGSRSNRTSHSTKKDFVFDTMASPATSKQSESLSKNVRSVRAQSVSSIPRNDNSAVEVSTVLPKRGDHNAKNVSMVYASHGSDRNLEMIASPKAAVQVCREDEKAREVLVANQQSVDASIAKSVTQERTNAGEDCANPIKPTSTLELHNISPVIHGDFERSGSDSFVNEGVSEIGTGAEVGDKTRSGKEHTNRWEEMVNPELSSTQGILEIGQKSNIGIGDTKLGQEFSYPDSLYFPSSGEISYSSSKPTIMLQPSRDDVSYDETPNTDAVVEGTSSRSHVSIMKRDISPNDSIQASDGVIESSRTRAGGFDMFKTSRADQELVSEKIGLESANVPSVAVRMQSEAPKTTRKQESSRTEFGLAPIGNEVKSCHAPPRSNAGSEKNTRLDSSANARPNSSLQRGCSENEMRDRSTPTREILRTSFDSNARSTPTFQMRSTRE